MVRSAIVRVACLDLQVLQTYFEERGEVEVLLKMAAEADRRLYSSAVQEQVGQGTMDGRWDESKTKTIFMAPNIL